TNPGHGVHPPTAKGLEWLRLPRHSHPSRLASNQAHPQSCCSELRGNTTRRLAFGATIHHHGIGSPSSRTALTQRPRRQHATITEPARAVDHENLAVAPQPQMLQAIIGEDDAHPARNQLPCRGNTVARNESHASRAPTENQRLIADLLPERVRADDAQTALLAAVATRHDAHCKSTL